MTEMKVKNRASFVTTHVIKVYIFRSPPFVHYNVGRHSCQHLLQQLHDPLHLLQCIVVDQADPHYAILYILHTFQLAHKRVCVEVSEPDADTARLVEVSYDLTRAQRTIATDDERHRRVAASTVRRVAHNPYTPLVLLWCVQESKENIKQRMLLHRDSFICRIKRPHRCEALEVLDNGDARDGKLVARSRRRVDLVCVRAPRSRVGEEVVG
jgi:hypothetical protein